MTDNIEECLKKFIFHVDNLGKEDEPGGDGFWREFKVSVSNSSQHEVCDIFISVIVTVLCHDTTVVHLIFATNVAFERRLNIYLSLTIVFVTLQTLLKMSTM